MDGLVFYQIDVYVISIELVRLFCEYIVIFRWLLSVNTVKINVDILSGLKRVQNGEINLHRFISIVYIKCFRNRCIVNIKSDDVRLLGFFGFTTIYNLLTTNPYIISFIPYLVKPIIYFVFVISGRTSTSSLKHERWKVQISSVELWLHFGSAYFGKWRELYPIHATTPIPKYGMSFYSIFIIKSF